MRFFANRNRRQNRKILVLACALVSLLGAGESRALAGDTTVHPATTALAITTTSPLPTGTVGVNYSTTLAATGGTGGNTWAVTVGALPTGLSLAAGTGTISGQPTTAGSANFTIQVTDSAHATASKAFAMTIDPALSITTTSPLPTGTVGVNYSTTVAATGGSGTYAWAVTAGALPAGLTLHTTTGAIRGTPTAAGPGSFTIQVKDSTGATASKAFTMTIDPALSITTTSPLPTGTVGVDYGVNLAATGGSGSYTWAVTVGALPAGLSLRGSSGEIRGSPTAAGPGSFTIQVTDTTKATASKAFTVTINPGLVITTTSPLPTGTVGVSYATTLTATGGSGYTWAVTAGALPAGLSLGASTGTISGQPTTAGPGSFTIQVTDSAKATASQAFTMTIDPALAITTSSPLPTGTVGVNYSTTVAATGGSGAYTWSVTAGALPAGLSLAAATGAISGQPTAAGAASFTIQATDSTGATASKAFTMTINAALLITTTSPLPIATPAIAYSQTFAASGGAGGYSWSATGLPSWLSLSTAGLLTGTPPLTATDATFTVKVTDSSGNNTSAPFYLPVTLAITTATRLPAATIMVAYSETFAASGGAGGYSWSATGLPTWLSLSTAGVLTGTPPLTASDATFTVKVTDSSGITASAAFSLPVTLTITTTSPLPAGQLGVSYSLTLAAIGGTGRYTWSVTTGSLPAGLTLTAAGLMSGTPTAVVSSAAFTIQAEDTIDVTASLPVTLTINPAASIQTLSPNSSFPGLSVQVTITGAYTHFAQGTTVASFGPGIAVGGGTAGEPGPVTVTSATSATAALAIAATATPGAQTVTVTTGTEQASLTNGFTILPAFANININTTKATPIATGFSGFDDEHLITGVEYYDPKWISAVEQLKPGWIRFPAGMDSMAFDWQAGYISPTWLTELSTGNPPEVPISVTQALSLGQGLTQAQGGIFFSDYATFLKAVGASFGIVAFNGFTDTNLNSAYNMVVAAQSAGIDIREWEFCNEAYYYTGNPGVFSSPQEYASSMYNPYYTNWASANPTGAFGVFFEGEFSGYVGDDYQLWDQDMSTYSPRYWGAVSDHIYPITDTTQTTQQEEESLNGILAHGTNEYLTSYLLPLIGVDTPLFITELNNGPGSIPFQAYLYNGIYMAEYIARMSAVPNVKGVGATALYLGNSFDYGLIRAVDDFQDYLIAQVQADPTYSTDTATNPNTQFQFYFSAPALALEVLNLAINNSAGIFPTAVTGSPTVPIIGYDGQPIPAVFAQAYQGTDGTNYVVITNKSGSSVPMAIIVNGGMLAAPMTVSYVSNASDIAQNTATEQTNVQIVNTTSPNPITLGPYSVTRVQW